jgi:hypothetical protein
MIEEELIQQFSMVVMDWKLGVPTISDVCFKMGFIQHPLTFYTAHGWSVPNHKWVCDPVRQAIVTLAIIYTNDREAARDNDGYCNTLLALFSNELMVQMFDAIVHHNLGVQ